MKKLFLILASILMFLVGTGAATGFLTGIMVMWFEVETFDAILWSIIPGIIFGIWVAKLVKD